MNTIEFLQISSAVVPEREALVEVGGSDKRVTYGEMYPLVVNRLVTRALNEAAALGAPLINRDVIEAL